MDRRQAAARRCRKLKDRWRKAIVLGIEVSLVLLALALGQPGVAVDSGWPWLGAWSNVLALACVAIGGVPILIETIHAIIKKDVTADVLFLIALGATVFLGGENHVAAATLVLMMGTGEFLEAYLLDKTNAYVGELARLEPETAMVRRDGRVETVSVATIQPGDMVLVRSGERVPVDGTVVAGSGEIDTALLTGEHEPVLVGPGYQARAGTLVLDGDVDMEATATSKDSYLGRIGKVIEGARLDKPRMQQVTDAFARAFAPMVIAIAALTWVLTGNLFYTIAVLIVSCPCSLVISVPASFIAALGNAARRGTWIRSGSTVETLGKVTLVVLDKTGTLTLGRPVVSSIEITGSKSPDMVYQLLLSVETRSAHPFAKAIVDHVMSLMGHPVPLAATGVKHEPGQGISATVDGHGTIHVGNKVLLERVGIQVNEAVTGVREDEYLLHVFSDDECLGIIRFRDVMKQEARDAVSAIRKAGVPRVAVISGDAGPKTSEAGTFIDADLALGHVDPEGKLRFVKEARGHGATVAMIGDGVNDAPAIAAANVGIAMGKDGSAVACEEADVIIADDDMMKVARVLRLGKRCVGKAYTNIVIAILMNFLGILLSATGFLSPLGAAAWHVAQSLLVVGNAALLLWSRG